MAEPVRAEVALPKRAVRALPTPRLGDLAHLAVVPDTDGPRVRLGLAWAGLTYIALAIGPVALAVWMAAAALFAAAQANRTWRKQALRPVAPVAVFGAALVPLAAAGGLLPAAAVAVAVAVAALLYRPVRRGVAPDPFITGAIGAGIGLAAAAPVALVAEVGTLQAFVLLTMVFVYDASAYVVGSGSSDAWEGPAAGAAFILAVTLLVAAVLVPPFRGLSPWALGFLAAVLAPVGTYAATALLGNRSMRAPAVRRLDSLLVLGPVWVLVCRLLAG